MPGTSVGRVSRANPDIPAAIAPEVTIRYSFFDRSNWSTMPRNRLISICPPGAMRLVPTLMTTRIFCNGYARANSPFIRHRMVCSGKTRHPGGEGQYLYPAVRMAFWQVEKSFEVTSECP